MSWSVLKACPERFEVPKGLKNQLLSIMLGERMPSLVVEMCPERRVKASAML